MNDPKGRMRSLKSEIVVSFLTLPGEKKCFSGAVTTGTRDGFFLYSEVCLFNVGKFAGFVSGLLQTAEDTSLLLILD